MKGKKLYIILIIVAACVAAGVLFLVFSGALQPKAQPVDEGQAVQTAPTRMPENIGLTMTARADKKAVKFVITKVDGIKSVDYELTYMATGNQSRGIIGSIAVKPEDKTIDSGYLDLGSCSSGVCKYDTGVKSVDLKLSVTTTGGSSYVVNDTLKLQ